MIDYTLILRKRYAAEWTLNGDNYENLVWLSDSPKPTKEELDALWQSVLDQVKEEKQAKIAAKEAAQAKLAALGLTLDDLKALGL
jgi:hypothetical protein